MVKRPVSLFPYEVLRLQKLQNRYATLKYFTKLNEFYSKKYGYVSVLFFSSSVGCATSKHESHQKNGEHTAISSPYAVTVAS